MPLEHVLPAERVTSATRCTSGCGTPRLEAAALVKTAVHPANAESRSRRAVCDPSAAPRAICACGSGSPAPRSSSTPTAQESMPTLTCACAWSSGRAARRSTSSGFRARGPDAGHQLHAAPGLAAVSDVAGGGEENFGEHERYDCGGSIPSFIREILSSWCASRRPSRRVTAASSCFQLGHGPRSAPRASWACPR